MSTANSFDSTACCSGDSDATPLAISNAPGLPAVGYRIGAQADFKAAMLDALSLAAAGPLRGLQTREDDDFTIALLDGWATTLDVLTFYQERLANESWLGTAVDRRSVVELARLTGYQPRPGVAAEAALAFTLEDADGAPRSVLLDVGVAVQSIPDPGEQQVTFETVEQMELRPEWNKARPRRYDFFTALDADAAFYWVNTAIPGVKPGDLLLILSKKINADGTEQRLRGIKRITAVTTDPVEGRSKIEVKDELPTVTHDEIEDDAIIVLGTKTAPFGHNAPPPPPPGGGDWSVPSWSGHATLVLERDIDPIPPFAMFAVVRPNPKYTWWSSFTVQSVLTISVAAFGMSGRATQLTIHEAPHQQDPWLARDATFQDWRNTTIYIETRRLPLAGLPVSELVAGNSFFLDQNYYVYPARDGQQNVVSPGYFPAAFLPGRRWILRGQTLQGTVGTELVTIERVEYDDTSGLNRVILTLPLTNSYDPMTLTVLLNIVRGTHGETVGEILGSGNGGQPWQQFTLRQGPLTYTGDGVASGGTSTLEIQANGLLWRETPSFYEAGPNDRVFTTRTGDDGRTTVNFGDGRNGARLPSGVNNVQVIYRKGSGAGANVRAGQLTLLRSRPPGVRAVTNPLPAAGGVDPEPRDDARHNAPMTARTLDRVVSLQDYADSARAFAGIAKADASEDAGRILLSVVGPGGSELSLTGPIVARLAAALRQIGDPTVPLQIVGARCLRCTFDATLRIAPGTDRATVLAAARGTLLRRFGFDPREFRTPLSQFELIAALQQTPGVVAATINKFDVPGYEGDSFVWPNERGDHSLLPAWLIWIDETKLQITAS